jgi:glycerophosphoryl diester phosphodiesterase
MKAILITIIILFQSNGLIAQTVVIGHRGGDARSVPENTVECVVDSFSKGVWGHELDVRTTADGALMLMHDATVDRTTDGTGVFSELSASEVRALDAGAWKSAQYSGLKVPYLEEALLAIKGNGSRSYLDIKVATAAGVQEVVDTVGFPENKLTFLTFYKGQSLSFIEEFPTADVFRSLYGTAYASEEQKSSVDSLLAECASIGVKGVTIRANDYNHEYVAAIHAAGLKVALVKYRSDSLSQTVEFIEQGVDELWLDDITVHLKEFDKSGEGSLVIPGVESFAMEGVTKNLSSGEVCLSWSSLPGETYKIEMSSNLVNWELVESSVVGSLSSLTTEYNYHPPEAESVFYRLVWLKN